MFVKFVTFADCGQARAPAEENDDDELLYSEEDEAGQMIAIDRLALQDATKILSLS